MTSYDEYVTDLEEQHSLVPEQVLVRTYNYRDPYSPQAVKTIINNDIPEGITSGESITTPIITSQTAIFTQQKLRRPRFTPACAMNVY